VLEIAEKVPGIRTASAVVVVVVGAVVVVVVWARVMSLVAHLPCCNSLTVATVAQELPSLLTSILMSYGSTSSTVLGSVSSRIRLTAVAAGNVNISHAGSEMDGAFKEQKWLPAPHVPSFAFDVS